MNLIEKFITQVFRYKAKTKVYITKEEEIYSHFKFKKDKPVEKKEITLIRNFNIKKL